MLGPGLGLGLKLELGPGTRASTGVRARARARARTRAREGLRREQGGRAGLELGLGLCGGRGTRGRVPGLRRSLPLPLLTPARGRSKSEPFAAASEVGTSTFEPNTLYIFKFCCQLLHDNGTNFADGCKDKAARAKSNVSFFPPGAITRETLQIYALRAGRPRCSRTATRPRSSHGRHVTKRFYSSSGSPRAAVHRGRRFTARAAVGWAMATVATV